jgi:hypothetical protein
MADGTNDQGQPCRMRWAHLQTGGTFFAAHWGSLATLVGFCVAQGGATS